MGRNKKNDESIWKTGECVNLPPVKPLANVKKLPAEGRDSGTWGGGYSKP